ncbi:MAG: DNA-binding response regulator [Candidatus Neomarinimicrobiota bacterium]|nr:MAG: DNA-binding response regulator [Candidatus Neomarinimicrobiota bacterium]
MRLLLVEDEPAIGSYIQEHFQDLGYSVIWVRTYEDALETAVVEEFDCIILDRRLPDQDGLELCRELRQQGNNTPVLVLTALSGVDQRVEGLHLGADDYLAKPFDMDELAARVQALIRRSSYRNQPNLTIRNITLNSMTRTVTIDQRQVALSNREFLLLEYLMRHADQALTRSQILEHVWEGQQASDTNIVDVYINYIRKKIDIDGQPSNIETVRGYGYRFRYED